MSAEFSVSGDFQFDFDPTYQGFNPFEGLDFLPEIDMDFISTSPDFSFDGFAALEPSMDELAMTPAKERKLSASRWAPCTPPPQPQWEPSQWVPIVPQSELSGRPIINSYPDPEQLFGAQQTQYASLPYFAQPRPGNNPFHNFSQITPPGRQLSSINYPMFTPGNVLPLGPPPKGKSRQGKPCVDLKESALSPLSIQPGQKRKRPALMSLPGGSPAHDSDSSLSSAPPSPSSSITNARPPAGEKKKGRPYVYKQTKETIERNARRKADYHKRKHDPAYMAKMNRWSREYYQRRRYGRGRTTEKARQAEEVDEGEESEEYVFGRLALKSPGEEVGLRRSSRQPKPIFANLEF
ncbi:hypothetical protein N7G274_008910 [Stereocaulon virgatum]|uniref:BZIP domain-containing protein n=1 Tax=Stereocaulon virgatum TaxID=373712 RepID=A0ABR3ZZ34_9LECA